MYKLTINYKQIDVFDEKIDMLCVFLKCPQSLQVIQFYWEKSSISDALAEFILFFMYSFPAGFSKPEDGRGTL